MTPSLVSVEKVRDERLAQLNRDAITKVRFELFPSPCVTKGKDAKSEAKRKQAVPNGLKRLPRCAKMDAMPELENGQTDEDRGEHTYEGGPVLNSI